jgi:hypothetical protein
MVQGYIPSTLVALGFLFITGTSQPTATPAPISLEQINSANQLSLTQKEFVWVVKPEESLASIAEEYYGDADYWSVIWEDNDWITDPNTIEEGAVVKLRSTKPDKPNEALIDKYLTKQQAQLAKQAEEEKQQSTQAPVHSGVAVIAPPQPQEPQTVRPGATGPLSEAQITFLGNCESGMTANRNSGNGFYGAFQFLPSTWRAMNTGYERADFAPLEVQKDAVQRLLSRSSIWTQFPGCARKMQAAGLL